MAPDNDLDGATNEEPPYASVPSMVPESQPDSGSKASSFQAMAAADLESLLGKTKAQSTGQKRPSNKMELAFSQKSLKLEKAKQPLLTCRLMKKSCKKLMKAGLVLILGNLAARINRY